MQRPSGSRPGQDKDNDTVSPHSDEVPPPAEDGGMTGTDFWTMSGAYLIQHHIIHRRGRDCTNEDHYCLAPLEYIDAGSATSTCPNDEDVALLRDY